MSKSGYSTPELMKMPAKELYLKSDDTLVKIAQQMTSVVNKRISRMHDKFGEAAYKYVTDFEDAYSDRKDFRNWDRDELELYVKSCKNFLNAKTSITGYTELVEKNFDKISNVIDNAYGAFGKEKDELTISDKALFVRDLFDKLHELKEEYPAEFNQYGSDQELNLIAESFQYYRSRTLNIKDMPLLMEAMRKHKTIKQLKKEEFEKMNLGDKFDTVYNLGGFWGVE